MSMWAGFCALGFCRELCGPGISKSYRKKTPMDKKSTRIIVVLGSGLKDDGSATPVTDLRARAVADAIVNQTLGSIDFIVCSGKGSPDTIGVHGKTEAQAMSDIIVSAVAGAHVVPTIKLEDQSLDTFGNVIFTADRFLRPAMVAAGTLIVVTSPFHMDRAVYMFEKVLGAGWQIERHPCAEWDKETRQSGAPAAMDRARDFFADLGDGDIDACLAKIKGRGHYK
jgi:DUF218 domain